jgi:hypothetical protein
LAIILLLAPSNTNYLHIVKTSGVKYAPDVIISFAGDEPLAKDLFKHLSTTQATLQHAIASDLSGDEIRIYLKENGLDNLKRVKKLVDIIIIDYLFSHKLEGYKVTQLDNILTVGIPKGLDEISSLKMCEICGWRVNTEEELLIHRRTHWI